MKHPMMIAWVWLSISLSPARAEELQVPSVPDVVLVEEKMPAEEPAKPAPAVSPKLADPSERVPAALGDGHARRKNIEFEDDVIEGMKNDPLGAIQPIHRKGDGLSNRLYRYKPDFKREIQRTTTEMGYGQ